MKGKFMCIYFNQAPNFTTPQPPPPHTHLYFFKVKDKLCKMKENDYVYPGKVMTKLQSKIHI